MTRIPNFADVAFEPVAPAQPAGSAEPWLTPEGIPVKPAYGEADLEGRLPRNLAGPRALSGRPLPDHVCQPALDHPAVCRFLHGGKFQRVIGGPRIEIMTGAFDRPDRVVPTRQYGTESRLGWVVGIANLPSQTTMQNYGPEKMATIVSHQHPDHD